MKGIFWKEGEAFTNSMSLIVSLLVRYPGIATISLDPEQKTLQFTFIIARTLSASEFQALTKKIRDSLEAMAMLVGREGLQIDLALSGDNNMSFLEIKRDINSLLPEEIALLTALIDLEFQGELICDQDDAMEEEDQALQEEMIERMLEDLRDSRQEKKLIGFREEGRVLVFNRASLPK